MSSNSEPYPLSSTLQRIASSFRWTGWVSFWIQAVLAVFCTLLIIPSGLLVQFEGQSVASQAANPGFGPGFFLASLGIVVLYLGAYWAFRYTRLSRKLRLPDQFTRPKPGDFIQSLRIGLLINLVGILLTVLSGEALIGGLFFKAISLPQSGGTIFQQQITDAVRPIDIWIILGNTHVIFAHFLGISASLWLVRTMSRQ